MIIDTHAALWLHHNPTEYKLGVFRFDTADPYYVNLRMLGTDRRFSCPRTVLARLEKPPYAEVEIRQSGDEKLLLLTLAWIPPGAQVRYRVNKALVDAFLARTYREVSAGSEHGRVDWDGIRAGLLRGPS
ncbi:SsgA family sporulation/cell division regulator [Streptosporangium canum]|uniref:SsgA family sporulation/cell division regulator n=1 Tax=Streptosporangium canum TaxID=324952 RepID=UPI00343D8910